MNGTTKNTWNIKITVFSASKTFSLLRFYWYNLVSNTAINIHSISYNSIWSDIFLLTNVCLYIFNLHPSFNWVLLGSNFKSINEIGKIIFVCANRMKVMLIYQHLCEVISNLFQSWIRKTVNVSESKKNLINALIKRFNFCSYFLFNTENNTCANIWITRQTEKEATSCII